MSFKPYPVFDIVDHDGDTVRAHIDPGVDLCHTIDVRLMGVFAKELKQPGGPDAAAFVAAWLKERWPKHPMTVYTSSTAKGNERKTLGRFVGDVHDDVTNESLCSAIMTWLITHPDSAGGTGSG